MTKPNNPNITIPAGFAQNGQKTDFLEEKIQNGFDPIDPDVLSGDNLNKFIDDTYKGLNYSLAGVQDLYKGAVLYDENETYNDKSIVFNINESGEVAIYLSLTSENTGNPLSDTTKWKELTLGGSGLEVGDIGIAALGIDETKGLRRYLNGTILTMNANTTAFINKLKSAAALYPSLVCTETEWQSIASDSAGGQCGKFVINYDTDETTVVSVRLPKIIMPIQGLTDMTKLGELVEAGLPNITGHTSLWADTGLMGAGQGSGALTAGTLYNQAPVPVAGHLCCGIELDASLSNDIYGNSDTVQPEAIQYPYFIQISTGQETEVNITNEIELNNPYTLFDSKYSPDPLYNASWLKSDGTYYAKTVYVTAYEALVVENNTEVAAGSTVELPSGINYVKRGLSVKLSTAADITDYDFVINTTAETFRLPLKTIKANQAINGLYLYYYVGETVQNANLINAGRISEIYATKDYATRASFPSNQYIDLTLGASSAIYTAPANGWVVFCKTFAGTNQWVALRNLKNATVVVEDESPMYVTAFSGAGASGQLSVYMPVCKGDNFTASYTASGALILFKFIYAEGEEE